MKDLDLEDTPPMDVDPDSLTKWILKKTQPRDPLATSPTRATKTIIKSALMTHIQNIKTTGQCSWIDPV